MRITSALVFKYVLYYYLGYCGLVCVAALTLLRYANGLQVVSLLSTLVLIGVVYYLFKRSSAFIGVGILLLSYQVFVLFPLVGRYLPYRFDSQLYALDTLIFGKSLPLYFVPHLYPYSAGLGEYLAGCYLYLFILQLGSVIFWVSRSKHEPGLSQAFNFGILVLFCVGYLGYFLVPCAGPYLAYPQVFMAVPSQGWVADFLFLSNKALVAGIDAFPSLHVAFTVYIGAFYFVNKSFIIGLLLLPFNLGLIIATQYFAFHYGVDLLAGVVLGFVILWLTLLFKFKIMLH